MKANNRLLYFTAKQSAKKDDVDDEVVSDVHLFL